MADEKKAKDTQKPEGGNKVLNWIKSLPGRIARPFKNMVNELRRVTWPSKQKLIRYSIIVLVFVLAMMIIIGLFNLGSTELVKAIRFSGQTQTLTDEELAELYAQYASGAGEDTAAGEATAAGEETPAEGGFAGFFDQVRGLYDAAQAALASEAGEDAQATASGDADAPVVQASEPGADD